MAAVHTVCRAKLEDLPSDFSLSFLKSTEISLKSKQQGFKYFTEGYIHDVNMFWAADNTIATSAKSHRSMKKNEKPHLIYVDVSSTEISLSHCTCQAGAGGSCSHVVGYILALQQWRLMGFSEVPSHLTCTSLPQQWSKPRGPKIEAEAVPSMTFINPKPDRKKRPTTNTLTDCRKIKVQKADLQHLQSLDDLPISYLACNPGRTVTTYMGVVPLGSGLSTHADFFQPQIVQAVDPSCGSLRFPQVPVVLLDEKYTSLIDKMTDEDCIKIEESTRDQASNATWFEQRKTRLTSSNFGLILKRKKITDKFVESLVNPKTFTSAQTSYGKNNEKKAVQKYIKRTGNHVHECGLIINPKFPFLGASPDGKVCDSANTGLLEIKNPFLARDKSIKDACDTIPGFCIDGETMSIVKEHQYYYQVQGQLLVSGAAFCDFVVTQRKIFMWRGYFLMWIL